MLKARHYRDFKGCENCILIIGDAEDFRIASLHFSKLGGGLLSSLKQLSLESLNGIRTSDLSLTEQECVSFSEICRNLAMEGVASHDYFRIENIPDVEFLLSCGEYASFP